MAAGSFHWMTKGLLAIATGLIDLDTDDIRAMLVTASHTPSQDSDQYVSDIVANECADSGYARQTLASLAVAISSNEVRWDFADVDFGNSVSLTAKYLYVLKYNASDSSARLIGFVDLNTSGTGASATSTNGNFDIQINASGALKITRTAYSAGN